MESKNLSRQYLDTLSTADLIDIADSYGIDIPENLNRSFIIGELLEAAQEDSFDSEKDDITESDENAPVHETAETLPDTYNETMICAVLRNPAWIYVYWDIKASDISRLNSDFSFKSLCLRVSFWNLADDDKPEESFDVQIALSDRQQYILLSPGKNFVRVDLVARFSGKEDENLSVSRKIELPKGSPFLCSLPGRESELSPAVELSDMRELMASHFENHRQSFL